MFIIYVQSPVGVWEYYDTWKADVPDIITSLTSLIKVYDSVCQEYSLLTQLCNKGSYSGVNIKIFWEVYSYGIRN